MAIVALKCDKMLLPLTLKHFVLFFSSLCALVCSDQRFLSEMDRGHPSCMSGVSLTTTTTQHEWLSSKKPISSVRKKAHSSDVKSFALFTARFVISLLFLETFSFTEVFQNSFLGQMVDLFLLHGRIAQASPWLSSAVIN